MKMELMRKCPICQKVTVLEVEMKEMQAYAEGDSAMHAFPHMSSTEHEVVISGICPKCQPLVFKKG